MRYSQMGLIIANTYLAAGFAINENGFLVGILAIIWVIYALYAAKSEK